MISHDFVQTGFFGSMINNAKCSWYFSHLILAPCPGLVKRLTKLISQPATLKLKENIKKITLELKFQAHFFHKDSIILSIYTFDLVSNLIRNLPHWKQQVSTIKDMKLWRIKTFHGVSCTFWVQKTWNKTQNQRRIEAAKNQHRFMLTTCDLCDLLVLIRSDTCDVRWVRVIDRAEHIAFVWAVQTSESVTALLCGQLLERKRSAWSLKESHVWDLFWTS